MIKHSALKAVFEQSLALKKDESCLIITDLIKEDLGIEFYEYALKITDNAKIQIIEPTGEDGREPDKQTADMMIDKEVILFVTEYSLSHTKARWNAVKKGARIASMPGITEDMINRCMDVDYDELCRLNRKIKNIFENSNEVQMTTKKGTDITFRIPYVKGECGDYYIKGNSGNLPCGEVDCAIKDCNGILVVDGSFPGLGVLKEPLTIRIKDNLAVSIEGKGSEDVKKRLDAVGKKAYLLAEFAVGINPKAKITGNTLEDEKVLGTAHIALGNDASYNGSNHVEIHLDGVIRKPTIIVDKKTMMKEGKLLI